MDNVLKFDYIKENKKWLDALKTFNADHAIVDKYGIETKKKFVNSMLDILKTIKNKSDTESNEEKRAILESLKIAFRELDGIDAVGEKENVILFMEYANLEGKNQAIFVADESLKCLVNILVKVKPAIPVLVDNNGPEKLTQAFKECSALLPAVFPLCRIVFQLGLDRSLAGRFNAQSLVSHLAKLLDECVQNNPLPTITGEILRVVFNLTMGLGPLDNGQPSPPADQDINDFKKLLPSYKKILNLPESYVIKMSVVNCLINTPSVNMKDICEDSIVKNLLDVLKHQMKDPNPVDALTPILLVITSVAKEDQQACKYLKHEVFSMGPNVSVSIEGPKDMNILSNQLRKHLTAVNIALKHYVQEFLFVLCDEDAQEFVKMVGFGDAAGLLMDRKLFGALNSLGRGSSTQPAASSSATVNSTATTTTTKEEVNEEEEEDSEEESYDSEDEREAAELAAKIQRLQDLGVIQVMKG